MKLTKLTNLLVIAVLLTLAAAGCQKRPGYITRIPGQTQNPNDNLAAEPIKPGIEPGAEIPGNPLPNPELRQNWVRDSEVFKSDTVHFDFDSSVVKTAEKPKVAAVADYLKANAQNALEVDGHCDERGTEEYNRSLGERRALALREELIRLGIDPMRVDTVTYGKDRPADPGHNEAAWKQNRRGEFLLEVPPAQNTPAPAPAQSTTATPK